jgi:hypothetical protein
MCRFNQAKSPPAMQVAVVSVVKEHHTSLVPHTIENIEVRSFRMRNFYHENGSGSSQIIVSLQIQFI